MDDTASTPEDTAIDINVISNDTDVEGDTLSVTAVTTPTSGTAVILQGSTTTVTYTPNANFVGTDSFTYTVSDGTDTDTGTADHYRWGSTNQADRANGYCRKQPSSPDLGRPIRQQHHWLRIRLRNRLPS